MHAVEPLEEKVPGRQDKHPSVEEENLPASHTVQKEELARENHPAGQRTHPFAFNADIAKRPAAHGKQVQELPSNKYWPDLQTFKEHEGLEDGIKEGNTDGIPVGLTEGITDG